MHFKITRRLDDFLMFRILRSKLSCLPSSENVMKRCSVLALLLIMIFSRTWQTNEIYRKPPGFRITLSEKDAGHSIQIWEQIHDVVIFVNMAFDPSAYVLTAANKPMDILYSIQRYFT